MSHKCITLYRSGGNLDRAAADRLTRVALSMIPDDMEGFEAVWRVAITGHNVLAQCSRDYTSSRGTIEWAEERGLLTDDSLKTKDFHQDETVGFTFTPPAHMLAGYAAAIRAERREISPFSGSASLYSDSESAEARISRLGVKPQNTSEAIRAASNLVRRPTMDEFRAAFDGEDMAMAKELCPTGLTIPSPSMYLAPDKLIYFIPPMSDEEFMQKVAEIMGKDVKDAWIL